MTPRHRSALMTVAEVALVMRLSKATVYRLMQAGEIPAVRFGRSYRVSEAAVSEYVARSGLNTNEGSTAPDER